MRESFAGEFAQNVRCVVFIKHSSSTSKDKVYSADTLKCHFNTINVSEGKGLHQLTFGGVRHALECGFNTNVVLDGLPIEGQCSSFSDRADTIPPSTSRWKVSLA